MATDDSATPMDGSAENPVMYFDTNGNGPLFHVCADAGKSRAATVRGWLDRQIMIGGVDANERAVIERLADDLEAGG